MLLLLLLLLLLCCACNVRNPIIAANQARLNLCAACAAESFVP